MILPVLPKADQRSTPFHLIQPVGGTPSYEWQLPHRRCADENGLRVESCNVVSGKRLGPGGLRCQSSPMRVSPLQTPLARLAR